MKSRFAQLLIFLVAVVAVTYVVSGFSRTMTDVVSGFSRTHTPSHDDGVWQAVRQVTTTTGTSFEIARHDLRTAPPRTLVAARTQRIGEFGGTSRDRSPQHSIPLLI
jgi:hypothetical protein